MMQRYSDELANGDKSDDKQLEDVRNPKWDVADDVGFVNQWKALNQKKSHSLVQTFDEEGSPSDEVANGDESENKQLEDEDDGNDDIVDDNGFSHQWVQTDANIKI